MDSLRAALTWVKDLLDWLPDPAVALLILAFAVLLALVLHRWASKLIRRALAERYIAELSAPAESNDQVAEHSP